mgnify:CR=1 FL=1
MTISSKREGGLHGGPAVESGLFANNPVFQKLVREVAGGGSVSAGGLWGSSQALLMGELSRHAPGPWLVVTSSEPEAEAFTADLEALEIDACHLPARETYASGSHRKAHADPETIRGRLKVAGLLGGPVERRPRLIVASLLACLQPLPVADTLEREFLHLQIGGKLDPEVVLMRLALAGYSRQPLAEAPGEVSLRGDILDLFPFANKEPLRIELFDDEVESIRLFDPETQRSTESMDRIAVCIASDAGDIETGHGKRVDELIGPTAVVTRIEPLRVADMAEGLRIQSSSHGAALLQWNTALEQRPILDLQTLPARGLAFEVRSVQGLSVGMTEAAHTLGEALDRAGGKARAVVLCSTDAELARMSEVFCEDDRIELRMGVLGRGFQLTHPPLFVINHRELVGIQGTRRVEKGHAIHKARALQSFFELRLGDYIVHAVHGLGRYLGLKRMKRGSGEEEHLCLEYKDEVILYVPASRVDLVQRYIASGKGTSITLDRIGAQSFKKRKEKVEKALADLAAELLEVQAKREMKKRPAWFLEAEEGEPATEEQVLISQMIREFPYIDTPDQALADSEIHADLIGPLPMDRLLCGDVGFGKTEVAIRAAFRVVAGGGQVAVLVPTTVLAGQHSETFRIRLADFPVRTESLSRYVTAAKAREIAEATGRGEVDILIGTHRILSKDVKFKNLGLIIIDEEQRFGVTHKEHFKKLRAQIDILTLSATPIPRTLHMSMAGLRDISALTTPPPGRQDIETILAPGNDKQAIREALLREHNRGGQSFFLHNRVTSIDRVARELAELVPECSFVVGHGQMGGRMLQKVMGIFTRGEADVLVATTIIENGIDIPSAGTILMDRANHFGLSELHQLRGRVGRGSHKSYCYLLTDEEKTLTDIATQRLKALEELNHLGAGFAISMKDLELRGAGNILGPEQSGHITSVGYDLYCRLLRKTVERMQRGGDVKSLEIRPDEFVDALDVELELGLASYLDDKWIPSADSRLELLRSFNEVRSKVDEKEALAMLRDRYGRVPAEAKELVRQFRLRSLFASASLTRVTWREDLWLIEYRDRATLEGALGVSGARIELRPLAQGRAFLMAPKGLDARKALEWLEAALLGDSKAKRISLAAQI